MRIVTGRRLHTTAGMRPPRALPAGRPDADLWHTYSWTDPKTLLPKDRKVFLDRIDKMYKIFSPDYPVDPVKGKFRIYYFKFFCLPFHMPFCYHSKMKNFVITA